MANLGRGDRLRASFTAVARSFLREPVQVAVLLVVPLVVIEGYGYAMTAFPEFPFVETDPETLGRLSGAIYAVAFLSAVLGLFQVISAVQADDRLHICGYSRTELFLTRLSMVVGASLLVSAVSLGVLSLRVTIGAPLAAFGSLTAGALLYGLIGMLVGAVLPRTLEGSLVLVFLVDADDFLSSGFVDIDSPLLALFPLYHPHELFTATVDGSVPAGPAVATGGYLAVLLAVVAVVYIRLTSSGGVLSG